MNLVTLLESQARERGSNPALVESRGRRERVVTFQGLHERVAATAGGLRRVGLKREDRIILLHPIGIELYVMLLAVLRVGGVAVIVDPGLERRRFRHCVRRAAARALFASRKAQVLACLTPELRRVPVKLAPGRLAIPGFHPLPLPSRIRDGVHSIEGQAGVKNLVMTENIEIEEFCNPEGGKIRDGVHSGRASGLGGRGEDGEGEIGDGVSLRGGVREGGVRLEDVSGTAPALLTFTSGSTGEPKAAMRSHGFLLAQHRVLQGSIRLEPGEVDLPTLPVFVLANLASGVTSVLPDADLRRPGFIDPAPVLRQIERHGVTRSAGSPAFFERLAERLRAEGRTEPGLEKLFTGGAPVFPGTLRRLKRAFPNADPEVVYGSTEAEPISHVRLSAIGVRDLKAMRSGSGLLVGSPVPEIDLAILPDRWGDPTPDMPVEEFDARRLPAGQAGEIVVAGDHVLPGYLDGAGDAETKFTAGGRRWHRTGDAGVLDETGRLWLLGRCGAKIVDKHGVTYPFAVECAVEGFEWVVRSAFLELNGERTLAVELCGEIPLNAEKILLTSISWSRCTRVIRVKHIPVDSRHNAKVDYPALVAAVEAGRGVLISTPAGRRVGG